MIVYPIYPIEGTYQYNQKFDVSVIVPLYKSEEVIVDQIRDWHSDDRYSVEIVYVDDKCPHMSKHVVEEEWNKRPDKKNFNVKLVLATKNNGFAGACNIGANHASGKYLIFLNADTVVTPNWIGPMIDLFQDPKVGIVGNLQIKQGGKFDGTIDGAGSEWSWEFMNFMHIGRHFYHGRPLVQPMLPAEAPADIMCVGEREMVTGCCLAIPKMLFNEVGGFDQTYRIGYWEDTELNLRVREAGYKILFQPTSVIYHKLGHSNISLHEFATANKNQFVNRWIINRKLDQFVKEKRPNDLVISTTENLDRICSPRMTYYRRTYRNSVRWDGREKLQGKRVIVYCEQGFGDTIQFVRYIKALKNLGCYTILHCAIPLHTLFVGHVEAVDEVFDKDNPNLPPHDYHVLSMSLPFLIENAETTSPYIRVDEKTDIGYNDKFKIGIAWEGSPDHSNNILRSCSLSHFKEIEKLSNVKLFMLQKQIHIPELVLGCEQMELLGVGLVDFLDTAKFINALDLVVSVDTSVLHLAGAMNKPAIGLLSTPCDTRWDVKEWYPSVKLIRQKEPCRWDYVFDELVQTMKGLIC